MPRVPCDYCGQEIYRRPSSLQEHQHKFCSRQCQSLWQTENQTVDALCDMCGNSFRRIQSLYNASIHHFCSVECKRAQEQLHRQRIKRICEACGKTFLVYPSHVKYHAARFCSNECAGTAIEWPELVCIQCEKPFKVIPSRIAKARFCSKDCRHAFDSEHKSGAANHNWKGGPIGNYGHNWARQRKRALKRDHVCRICGISRNLNGRDLSIHHVRPIRDFPNPRKANFLANLITLCEPCHKLVEQGQIICPVSQ